MIAVSSRCSPVYWSLNFFITVIILVEGISITGAILDLSFDNQLILITTQTNRTLPVNQSSIDYRSSQNRSQEGQTAQRDLELQHR